MKPQYETNKTFGGNAMDNNDAYILSKINDV